MIRITKAITAVLAVAGLMTAACGNSEDGDGATTATVVVGTPGAASDAGFLIALHRGYFDAVGIKVNYQKFEGGGDLIPVLSTGRVDVGGLSVNSGLVNAIAGGNDLRIVADKGSYTDGSTPSYGALLISPRLEGKVHGPEDLKGLTIAEGAAGTTHDVGMSEYLAKGGLTLDDVKPSVLGQAERVIALEKGAADLAFVFEPYLSEAIRTGAGKILADGSDLRPNQQTAVIVYSGAWAKKNPKVAQAWMSAYVCGLQDFNDARQHGGEEFDDVIKIIADATGDKPEDLKRMAMPAFRSDGAVNEPDLAHSIEALAQLGFAKKVDPAKAIDPSYGQAVTSCDDIRSTAEKK